MQPKVGVAQSQSYTFNTCTYTCIYLTLLLLQSILPRPNNVNQARHVFSDQGTSQKGAHDSATNAREIPQRYSHPPTLSRIPLTPAPGQLGRVAVIGGSERYVEAATTLLSFVGVKEIDFSAAIREHHTSPPWHPQD